MSTYITRDSDSFIFVVTMKQNIQLFELNSVILLMTIITTALFYATEKYLDKHNEVRLDVFEKFLVFAKSCFYRASLYIYEHCSLRQWTVTTWCSATAAAAAAVSDAVWS